MNEIDLDKALNFWKSMGELMDFQGYLDGKYDPPETPEQANDRRFKILTDILNDENELILCL